MAPYIGTPISRVESVAKVTGAAKYAAEFNVPGLAYGSVITSTIAKGRIVRIDPSAAMRVKGVIDVLTHENRPHMADNDEAYKDETAPYGSPFRPLYDSRIVFDGQPIALVVAETSEIARFAASLVRVEYEKDAHITDVYRRREAATPVKPPTNPFEALFTPPKTRGTPERALAAAAVRQASEYYVPIEHHNPMELYAATVVYATNGKLMVYDKTQGVQNVQRYLCGVFGMKPEDVRVMSPFMGGGFGSGLRPQFEVVLAVIAALARTELSCQEEPKCKSSSPAPVTLRLTQRLMTPHPPRLSEVELLCRNLANEVRTRLRVQCARWSDRGARSAARPVPSAPPTANGRKERAAAPGLACSSAARGRRTP
jgi:xanthine dehydrogenase YagR molybdenum-binding subunit